MHKSNTSAYLHLHFVIIILGFTAILGKLITLDAGSIVVLRMAIAFIGLGIWLALFKPKIQASPKAILQFLGVGLLVASHWYLFFEAIKVSNVSVTLVVLSSTPLFTALLSPLVLRTSLSKLEILASVISIAGIYLIFEFESEYMLGILLSIGAAFFAALFTVLNAVLIRAHDSRVISLYEMLSGTIVTGLIFFFMDSEMIQRIFDAPLLDWIWLLFLGLVCTAYAFMLLVEVMKQLTPFSVALAVNLEPVYGVLLALVIFGESETMSAGFYGGASVLLVTVFGYQYFSRSKS